MSRPYKVREGQVFGRLTTIKVVEKSKRGNRWLCTCVCGDDRKVFAADLTNGTHKSCGCLKKEILSLSGHNNAIHSLCRTIEYKLWKNMKNRCYNPNASNYKDYGGRGIKVCDEWRDNFVSFLSYIGNRPGKNYSIDRINSDEDYRPGNVRWALPTTQQNNRRNNITVVYDGIVYTIAQLSRITNIPYNRLHYLYRLGLLDASAIKDELKTRGANHKNESMDQEGVVGEAGESGGNSSAQSDGNIQEARDSDTRTTEDQEEGMATETQQDLAAENEGVGPVCDLWQDARDSTKWEEVITVLPDTL